MNPLQEFGMYFRTWTQEEDDVPEALLLKVVLSRKVPKSTITHFSSRLGNTLSYWTNLIVYLVYTIVYTGNGVTR